MQHGLDHASVGWSSSHYCAIFLMSLAVQQDCMRGYSYTKSLDGLIQRNRLSGRALTLPRTVGVNETLSREEMELVQKAITAIDASGVGELDDTPKCKAVLLDLVEETEYGPAAFIEIKNGSWSVLPKQALAAIAVLTPNSTVTPIVVTGSGPHRFCLRVFAHVYPRASPARDAFVTVLIFWFSWAVITIVTALYEAQKREGWAGILGLVAPVLRFRL